MSKKRILSTLPLFAALLAAMLAAFLSPAQAATTAASPAAAPGRRCAAQGRTSLSGRTKRRPAGQVTIKVGAVDPRLSLASCPSPEAFQQPGARPQGKTTVGVRCTAPVWTVFVQAQVSVLADYLTAAVPLARGQPIDASQLATMQGDIAAMPNGIITDMAQAIGRTPIVSLPAGAPLRLDALKSKPVVQQNQAVRIISRGENFSVSGEGKAIANAGEGQVVQVRTPRGAIISGTARMGGIVEVAL
ncbi:flagellar basal body P-ring formation chaperone FlgA [Massilia sp. Dwa41.01b]|uniref:flagellar basal body P-ring formation chaperone FlgA n=1 Tax=Massilia sp. Dwa41.01b TaxID=2709302 RepID=UPI001E63A6AD|nr:flagellar basal body P-ring formation chaperone FlgA [Massilia sp. Dwa41.01b]